MTIRTPSEAVEYARTYLNTGYNGLCLAHVQDAYGAEARYGSAYAAWQGCSKPHATKDLASAPYGAPIYWSQPGNPYGHIALHLTGDRMYTTDSGVGYPHEDSIAKWQRNYGYVPLGWSEDIENQMIPNLVSQEREWASNAAKGIIMQAIIQPNDDSRLVYFDGQQIHPLSHPDQVTALDMVAAKCGESLPHFKMGTNSAPWFTRLKEAVKNVEN